MEAERDSNPTVYRLPAYETGEDMARPLTPHVFGEIRTHDQPGLGNRRSIH